MFKPDKYKWGVGVGVKVLYFHVAHYKYHTYPVKSINYTVNAG
jgi:hypothetical protein